MSGRIVAVAVLALGLSAAARAQDRPLERTELDKRVVDAVYQTALLGTEIYNKGKHDECFRLYQGALTALQPLLDHRPALMRSVRDRVEKAKGMKPSDGAFALREALDEIQNEIAPSARSDGKVEPPPPAAKKATLWDRLGGEKVVRAIVKDFLKAAAEDKRVNYFRDGKIKLDAKAHAQMAERFVELVSLFAGGPLEYGKGAEKPRTLKDAHAGMKITDAEFDALLDVLRKTLESHKVGKAEADEMLKHFAATRVVIVEEKGKGM
jgi:hemoglobin